MQSKVSIVLAVYYPNLTFLKKQLLSINEQTYPNIELIICDDSNDNNVFEQLEVFVRRIITNFPFEVIRNSINLGSNKTFEKLTLKATGTYICYSDQDDIWETNKVELLIKAIEAEEGVLAYSDLSMIDENDELLSASFKASNSRLLHLNGDNCFQHFIRRNSVTGCAMLIRSEVAKKGCPFPSIKIFPHDHWLAICASITGKIVYVNNQLVKYRIHSNNQIGNKRLIGVNDLNDYYYVRIFLQKERMNLINEKYILSENQRYSFEQEKKFLEAREIAYKSKKVTALINLIKCMKSDSTLVMFELGLFLLPKIVSNKILGMMKK